MNSSSLRVLIVGAGPVGLTAALELARRGIRSRIIDKDTLSPLNESRALAVNHRTMDLLTPSGVAKLIDEEAVRLRQLQAFSGGKHLLTFDFGSDSTGEIIMRSLPQGRTERILAQKLKVLGIEPEWGVAFEGFAEADGGVPVAKLQSLKGAEQCAADIVIGADGAHSQVRKSLGIEFSGENLPNTFYLADVVYERDIEHDYLQANFLNPGVIACIPVNKRTLRYISTLAGFKPGIQHPEKIQSIAWESAFRVSFRHVTTMQKGHVFLAGDAAHIHSPVGGRGMNLGIEDACWLAWLISTGRQGEYTSHRMKAVKHVLAQTKATTRAILARKGVSLWLRNTLVPLAVRIPAVRRTVITGLRGMDTPAPPWLNHVGFTGHSSPTGD